MIAEKLVLQRLQRLCRERQYIGLEKVARRIDLPSHYLRTYGNLGYGLMQVGNIFKKTTTGFGGPS